MKTILVFVLLAVGCGESPKDQTQGKTMTLPTTEKSQEYINGFMAGKHSDSTDGWAVREYHSNLEWMLEENEKAGRHFDSADAAKLWREIIKGAEAWEKFHQSRTDDERRTEYYDPHSTPFWKQENGTPRTLILNLNQAEYESLIAAHPDDPGPVAVSIIDEGEGEKRIFGVRLKRRDESE